MGFTVKYRHLIKCFRFSNGYAAACLCKMFLDNKQTLNIEGIKLLNKKNWHDQQCKTVQLIAGKWSSTQGRATVRVRLLTSTKLKISHSANKINHENSLQWKIAWQISIFLGSFNTITKWCVSTFHQISVFNGKTRDLQTRKYDIRGSFRTFFSLRISLLRLSSSH